LRRVFGSHSNFIAFLNHIFFERRGDSVRLIYMLILLCGVAGAQSTTLGDQPWDVGVWVGGGISVPGGTQNAQAYNVGVRLGKILTDNVGISFLRGNFEWSADLLPLYYVSQPKKNAYAAGFNPVNLTWNFTSGSRLVPYLELGGGVLFSNRNIPAFTNTTNFVTHGGVGVHIFTREKRAVTFTTFFEHISNAGLASPNPGINSVQFTLGMNWFK
jgi:lipid A 3-O-deacylase